MEIQSDVPKLIEGVNKAFADFRAANDEALKAKDALLDEKVSKLNGQVDVAMDALRKRLSDVEVTQNRYGLGSGGQDQDTKLSKHAAAFHKRAPDSAVTQAEIDSYLEYKHAQGLYLRLGEKGLSADHQKAMTVGSDPQGGYWVEPDMSGRIVQLIYESSPIRQIANVQSITSDALEGPLDLEEMGAGWVEETGARPETSTPDIGKWRIDVHEMYANPRVSQKLLDDAAINVEKWIEKKLGQKFARLEGTAFVSGDGIIKPRGFLTYAAGTPSSTTWNVMEQTVSGASGAFASTSPGDALITLVYSLKAAYRAGARFVMSRSTLAAVRKLKDADGNYLWNPNFTEMGGGALVGFGVTEAEDMPALAANSLSIAFGNFMEGYQIVDRLGIRMLRDPYTAKPWVQFYTTMRVGGDVVNFEAIKLMKFSA